MTDLLEQNLKESKIKSENLINDIEFAKKEIQQLQNKIRQLEFELLKEYGRIEAIETFLPEIKKLNK